MNRVEYKSVSSVRVGDTSFELLIMTETQEPTQTRKCITKTSSPVIRISPLHNSPFHQDLVLYEHDGLNDLGIALINLSKDLENVSKCQTEWTE